MPPSLKEKKPRPARSATRPDPARAHGSDDCREERELVRQTLSTVVELLGGMLGDNVEVVLHDLTRPESSVVAIANGHISDRVVGDPILAGPKEDIGFAEAEQDASATGDHNSVVDAYHTVNKRGDVLHSATAIFRDANGTPFAALCLNADMAVAQMAHAWLDRMLNRGARDKPAQESGRKPEQMGELMANVIGKAISAQGKPVSMMSKEDKLTAVAAMQSGGLFIVRGGVGRAAEALGVTRFTIYNYLDELRQREA